ncbi:LuxR C-terminal-related transcriptional regulator [Actinacidiphila sp. ITFR-21]|uniref:LuxR C-terminal-related transcriptional regulator n=1 Tax=Actinacidiphila sp. ITFR-21 TaxID=3075199 RepID=UPI00288A4B89|nr:LuxR C-terminal-related transcriptional regulator [Streptomyces sp. ITFR-21]WNI17347.1 LuxR C-terminal-related transcriptional regulator [Streptomyces sp. ITFR-21]
MSDDMDLDQETLAVYRAVLLHHETDPRTVAKLMNLPEPQVAAAVQRLTELSLLAPSWEEPGRLRAVRPDVGLGVLLQREQQELAERQRRIEQSRAALASLAAEYTAQGRAGALDQSEEVVGIDEIRARLESLAVGCTQESLAFHPDTALTEESIEAGRPLNERALERGVRFRTLYLDSIAKDRTTREYAKWMADRGSEIRTSPTLPMRLLIVDGSAVVVAGLPTRDQPTALVLHSPPVVQAMLALFEAYWERATPLGKPAARLATGLTPQERQLLQLLAAGATDEAVSRALGIGVRTERRIVAELMDRLDASSRFEAGVKAARLDWV